MKFKKWTISGLMLLAMLMISLNVVSITAAETVQPSYTEGIVIANGEFKTNVTWTLDTEGNFTITGAGTGSVFQAFISNVDGLTKEECAQVRTVIIDGDKTGWRNRPSYNFEVRGFDENLFPKAEKLVLKNGARYEHINQGNKTIKYLEIPGEAASVSIYGYDVMEKVEVTGSVYEVTCNNCDVLTEVKVNRWLDDGKDAPWAASFTNNQLLESVSIYEIDSNTVKIGSQAFSGCTKLKNLEIPAKVTSVAERAFEGCTSMEKFPDFSHVQSVGTDAFTKCTSVTQIAFPALEGEEVGLDRTFNDCTALKEVQLSGSMQKLTLNNTFSRCYSLEKVIIEGNNLHTVIPGEKCFLGCAKLLNVETDASIPEVGSYAFNGCESLNELPDLSGVIGNYAFDGCSALTYLPDISKVTQIGQYAFQNCISLKKVNLNQIGNLSTGMFSGCTGLEQISIEYIENWKSKRAFSDCSSLESITVKKMGQPAELEGSAFYNCEKLNILNIPTGIKKISDSEFYSCKALKDISVLKELQMIGDSNSYQAYNVFYGCTSLEEVVLPETMEYYNAGSGFFEGCTSLKRVVLPKAIEKIEDRMFSQCISLEEIGIPEKLTTVGTNAFSGCTSLKTLELPDSVTKLSSLPDGLEIFCIPKGITDITAIFNPCKTLKEVVIPNTVVKMDKAFASCKTALEKVVFEDGFTIELPTSLFYGYTALKEVKLPTDLAKLPSNLFSGCTSLTNVTLPEEIEELPEKLFFGCTSLADIKLSEHLTRIGNAAFCVCTALKEIQFPTSITEIQEKAFYQCPLEQLVLHQDNLMIGADAFNHAKEIDLKNTNLTIAKDAFSEYQARRVVVDSDNVTLNNLSFSMAPGNGYVYFLKGKIQCVGTDETNGSIWQKVDANSHVCIYIGNSVEEITGYLSWQHGKEAVTLAGDPEHSIAQVYASSHNYELDENVEGNLSEGFQYRIENGEAIVTDYIGHPTQLEVPALLGNCKVTGIDKGVFNLSNDTSLTSISLPSTMKNVNPEFATSWAHKLAEITVAEDNPYLSAEKGVLYNKDKTKDKTKLLLIMPKVTEITIPDTVIEIGTKAFGLCKVSDVKLPDSVTKIGEYAFNGDYIAHVTLGKGIKQIDNYAFAHVEDLESITLPEGITQIGVGAFMNSGLKNITIPNGVTEIGDYAFSSCKMSGIDLPDTVESIGKNAFTLNDYLDYVTFGENVETVGENIVIGLHCKLYVIPGSTMESHVKEKYPHNYRTGTKVGDYTLGIEVKEDEKHPWLKHSGNEIKIILTRPMIQCEGVSFGVKDINDGKFYEAGISSGTEDFEDDGIDTTTTEKQWTFSTYNMASDMEVSFYIKEGMFRDPETKAETESWDSKENWVGKVMPDFWSTVNMTEKIGDNIYTWIFGKSKADNIKEISFEGTKGVCFGMTVTAALVKNGIPPISSFGKNSLWDVDIKNANPKSSGENGLEGLDIKTYCQLTFLLQATPSIKKQKNKAQNDFKKLRETLDDMLIKKNSLCVVGVDLYDGRGSHSLLPYAYEQISDNFIKVAVYDCNHPNEPRWLQIEKLDEGFDMRLYNDYNKQIGYGLRGFDCWKIDDTINEVAKAYAKGDKCPDLKNGKDLVGIRNFTSQHIVKINGIPIPDDFSVYEDELSEISNINTANSEETTKPYTRMFWLNSNGESEIEGLSDGMQAFLVGDYSKVQAGGGKGASVRMNASDSSEERSSVKVTPGTDGKFHIEISYPESAKKEIIKIDGTTSETAEVVDAENGFTMKGADSATITVIDGEKELTETVNDLSDYQEIHVTVTTDETDGKDGMLIEGDKDGDGNVDVVVPIKPTDPTDPTEPTTSTEPTKPTETTDTTETTKPTESTDTTETTKPTETTDTTETTKPTESTNTTEPTRPTETTNTTETTKPTETTEATKPTETTNSTETMNTTEATKPTEPTKPVTPVKVSLITLSKNSLELYPTQKTELTALVSPANAANRAVIFISSNPTVAPVTDSGVITAKAAGTARIQAKAADGSGVSAVCTVTVKKAKIQLNAKKVPLQVKKSSTALKASGLVPGDKVVSWSSSNKKAVTVSTTGKLKASKKTGKSVITAKTRYGAKASCIVTVQKKKVVLNSLTVTAKNLRKGKITLKRGQKITLTVMKNPITASDSVKYSTSSSKTAIVSKKGVITARKKGKCKITVKAGKKKKVISVTVK